MSRPIISLVSGIASVLLVFIPAASILFGIVAVGAGGPIKEDRRAVIGMLCGLAGIVIAILIVSATLETNVSS